MNLNERPDKIKTLESIFNNVNTWLHFAEAKNAAILAFNIAIISVINEFEFGKELKFIFFILQIAFFVSLVVALFSFSPILDKVEINMKRGDNINYILFSYIASFSDSNEYRKDMYKNYWNEEEGEVTQIERDFCYEIYENSKIVMRKYNFFKISLWIDITACFFLIMMFIVA